MQKTIDPSTTKEEVATGPGRLRPGDIVTGAVIYGQRVAIDVGLTTQARRTPTGPVHQHALDKNKTYKHLIEGEMRHAGLLFRAAIWSQEGRPGRDAREVIDGLVNMTHKYQPGTNGTVIRQRLKHELSVQCPIRLANRINACVPTPTGLAACIFFGLDLQATTNLTQSSDEDPFDDQL